MKSSSYEPTFLKKLLVQTMNVNINGKITKFLAIREIVLSEFLRGKGHLKKIINFLEDLKVPVIFHFIVNPRIFKHLKDKGYKYLYQNKHGIKIVSMYKIF